MLATPILLAIKAGVSLHNTMSFPKKNNPQVSITKQNYHKITLPIRNHSTFTENQKRIPVIYLSSDAVFDKTTPYPSESTQPKPQNNYRGPL